MTVKICKQAYLNGLSVNDTLFRTIDNRPYYNVKAKLALTAPNSFPRGKVFVQQKIGPGVRENPWPDRFAVK